MDIENKLTHMERSIDFLLSLLIDDPDLQHTVALMLKTPVRKPTDEEVQFAKTLAPRAAELLTTEVALTANTILHTFPPL